MGLLNVTDAAKGVLKAPVDLVRAASTAAGGISGAVGRMTMGAGTAGMNLLKTPAALGLRGAQALTFIATPIALLGGGLFVAGKISEHGERAKTPKTPTLPQGVLENQALLNANPMDVQTAQAINAQTAQIQQMMAAQPQVSAGSINHEGMQATPEAAIQA